MLNLKSTFWFLVILSLLTGCGRRDSKTVKLHLRLDNFKDPRIDITTSNLMNLDTILLASSKLDSNGLSTIEFKTDKPIFALVNNRSRYILLYVHPGDELNIEADTGLISSPAKFSGGGASIQNFLRLTYGAKDRCEIRDGKYSIEVGESDFLIRRDSLQKAYATILADLKKDKTASEADLDMMAFMQRASLYFFQQNYVLGHYKEEKDMPVSIQTNLKELPVDTMALTANMYDYGIVLYAYLRSKVFRAAAQTSEDLDLEMSVASEKQIEKLSYPKPIKDFLRAASINYYIRMDGLSPEIETLRTNFLKEIKTPLYVSTIDKSSEIWAPLAPGKTAPDFTGTTADGKSVSLSSLKGKVVYVDVWATWCRPCREEFPKSKKLIREFDRNDKVAFLFLSIDSNRDAWKKLLSEQSIPPGIHIHQKQEKQPDALTENYHLWGVPRYILIDADGKIVQAHAPRPSSGKVGDLLRKTMRI